MDYISLGFAVIFGLIFVVGLVSALLTDHLPLSEPLIALAVGWLIGTLTFSPLHVVLGGVSSTFIHTLAEVTLAIALMTTALQVPRGYLKRRWRAVLVLLGLGMPLMWLISSGLVSAVLGLPLGVAALVGAGITPTDPVLASTIVVGRLAERNIASRVRNLVIVESGLNDGLAYGFVLLPINLLLYPLHQALAGWFLYSVLWEVGGALVFGAALGLAAGWLANASFAIQATEHSSFLGLTLALSLLTLGVLNLLGTDAILGVFAAGLVFNETLGRRGHALERAEHLQGAVERFFDVPVFIVLGAVLPVQSWLAFGWRALAAVAAILLLRRMPVILLLKPLLGQTIGKWREAFFVGWFGPIGISALYYATLAYPRVSAGARLGDVWPAMSLFIAASIVAHGVTATPLTRLLGRANARARAREQSPEDDDEAAQVEAVTRDIETEVRDRVRETSSQIIEEVVAQHLHRAAEAARRSATNRAAIYEALERYHHGPDIGSFSEIGSELAREVAHSVAEETASRAAREVSERVAQNLGEEEPGERDGDGRGEDGGDASESGDAADHQAINT